jgi:hypothetical protein
MRRISLQAIRTLIWLGDDYGESNLALNLAEKITEVSAQEAITELFPPQSQESAMQRQDFCSYKNLSGLLFPVFFLPDGSAVCK